MYREVAILILLASSTIPYAFYREQRNLGEVSRECTLEESLLMLILVLKNPLVSRVLEEQREWILLHEKWLQKLQNSRNNTYEE